MILGQIRRNLAKYFFFSWDNCNFAVVFKVIIMSWPLKSKDYTKRLIERKKKIKKKKDNKEEKDDLQDQFPQ